MHHPHDSECTARCAASTGVTPSAHMEVTHHVCVECIDTTYVQIASPVRWCGQALQLPAVQTIAYAWGSEQHSPAYVYGGQQHLAAHASGGLQDCAANACGSCAAEMPDRFAPTNHPTATAIPQNLAFFFTSHATVPCHPLLPKE